MEKLIINRDGLPNSDHWETNEELYKILNDEFNFDFDPCPLHADFNGLEINWGKCNFVNPPYNRIDKPKFINKGVQQFKSGSSVVFLIPAATGTKQFQKVLAPLCRFRLTWEEWVENKSLLRNDSYIVFLAGRVAFKGYNTKGVYSTKNNGKHDSMIVVLRGNIN